MEARSNVGELLALCVGLVADTEVLEVVGGLRHAVVRYLLLGTTYTSSKRSNSMRPAGLPPIEMSKYATVLGMVMMWNRKRGDVQISTRS